MTITLTTDPLPSDITIESTTWEVFKTRDFVVHGDNVILQVIEDTTNKEEKEFDYDFTDTDVIYARYKHHYTGGLEDEFCYPIEIYKDDRHENFTGNIIATPSLQTTFDLNNPLEVIDVEATSMVCFNGLTGHDSSSWYLTDLEGNILWKREYDKFQKTNIRIPSRYILGNKVVIIRVVFHGQDGSKSNQGKFILSKDGNDGYVSLVDPDVILSSSGTTNINLKYSIFGVTSLSYSIVDKDNHVFDSNTLYDPEELAFKSLLIPYKGFKVGEYYDLHITIQTLKGTTASNVFRLKAGFDSENCPSNKSLSTVSYTSGGVPRPFYNNYTETVSGNLVPVVENGKLVLFTMGTELIIHEPPLFLSLETIFTDTKTISIFTKGDDIFLTGVKDDKIVVVKVRYFANALYLRLENDISLDIDVSLQRNALPVTTEINGENYDGLIIAGEEIFVFSMDNQKVVNFKTNLSKGLDKHAIRMCGGKFIKIYDNRLYLYNTIFDKQYSASRALSGFDLNKPYYLVKRGKETASLIGYDSTINKYVLFRINTTETTITYSKEIEDIGNILATPMIISYQSGELVIVTSTDRMRYTIIKD